MSKPRYGRGPGTAVLPKLRAENAQHPMARTWSAVTRVGKRGLLNGTWLKDPNGEIVATFSDGAIAKQCAAAMNLTTMKQRTDHCAEEAGYRRKPSQCDTQPLDKAADDVNS